MDNSGIINSVYIIAEDSSWRLEAKRLLETTGLCIRDHPNLAILHIIEGAQNIASHPRHWRNRAIRVLPNGTRKSDPGNDYLFVIQRSSFETLTFLANHFFKKETESRQQGVLWP